MRRFNEGIHLKKKKKEEELEQHLVLCKYSKKNCLFLSGLFYQHLLSTHGSILWKCTYLLLSGQQAHSWLSQGEPYREAGSQVPLSAFPSLPLPLEASSSRLFSSSGASTMVISSWPLGLALSPEMGFHLLQLGSVCSCSAGRHDFQPRTLSPFEATSACSKKPISTSFLFKGLLLPKSLKQSRQSGSGQNRPFLNIRSCGEGLGVFGE